MMASELADIVINLIASSMHVFDLGDSRKCSYAGQKR